MGSALISLLLFLGIIMVLRSLVFGVIPYLLKRKKEKELKKMNEKDQC